MTKMKTTSVHVRIKEDTKKTSRSNFRRIGNFESGGDRNVL